jgi:cyclin T
MPVASVVDEDLWIVDDEVLRNSPSRRDGISAETEKVDREATLNFLQDFGAAHGFDRVVVCTASVFLQRFFVLQSQKQHERFLVAIAALFLAGKVEEHPQHLKVIIPKFMAFRAKYGIGGCSAGNDPQNEKEREELLDSLVVMERVLLNNICFDLHIAHPQRSLLELLKDVKKYVVKELHSQLSEVTRVFLSDSFLTNACLRFPPRRIALACLFLTICHLRLKPVLNDGSDKKWLDLLPAVEPFSDIEVICDAILAIYDDSQRHGKMPRRPDTAAIRATIVAATAQKSGVAGTSSGAGAGAWVSSELVNEAAALAPVSAPADNNINNNNDNNNDDDSDDNGPPPPPPPPLGKSTVQRDGIDGDGPPSVKRARPNN